MSLHVMVVKYIDLVLNLVDVGLLVNVLLMFDLLVSVGQPCPSMLLDPG